MNATIDELVEQVRKELDEVTLAGERVQTDTDLADTASSNFSDASIKDRLLDGTRYVVARVDASHLDNFVETKTPSDFDAPYDDGSAPKIFRLLGSRVTAMDETGHSVRCTRRSFASHLKMQNQRGLVASADYPVFVYQDFELLIENGSGSSTKEVKVVKVPDQGVDSSYASVTNLSSDFRGAVVQYAVFTCFQTLRKQEEMENAKAILRRELQQYRLPFQRGETEREEEDQS